MPPFKHTCLLVVAAVLTTLLGACSEQSAQNGEPGKTAAGSTPAETLFHLLPSDKTHITFSNTLTENPYGNILMYQYFYNGGGVAVGDLNNDGLQDIYFSGNMVPNALYLNKGNMQFDNVTAQAGVAGKAYGWKTGVSMADVNGDGLLDIYACYSGSMPGEARANQLFINKGNDKSGLPVFEDQAPQYSLADSSFTTNALFFDYDLDSDLDMFLLNHNPAQFNNLDDVKIGQILQKTDANIRVKLYKNEQGHFRDVSDKAGLAGSAFTYALGAGVADINQDGWPDIYLTNDYSAPDYLYINNGDGTFTDRLPQSMGHTSLYSMGNDVADINNDGLPDVFAVDMLPEDNRRQKLLFAPDNYEYFNMLLRVGFNHQYMRNMLQLNNGDGTFSEIGQLTGISNTDWSWAPLFADYDNDGWKDLFVSNGFLRDFTNLDFIKYKSSFFQSGQMNMARILDVVKKIPASNVKNYIYKNNGNLTFSNQVAAWGLDAASNSNGAAYADLDNDGDLDLVMNNLNQTAFVYQNQAEKQLQHHYLQLTLAGAGKNTAGIGAKVTLYAQGQQQYQEQMPARGYQSSVPAVLHFGLGKYNVVDSVRVVWPSGRQQVLRDVKAGQVLAVQEKNAGSKYKLPKPAAPGFTEVRSPVAFAHQKNTLNDFKRQPLLVNPVSFAGPCLVKADVNGDGLEDVFAGGTQGQAGILYLQSRNGSFIEKPQAAFQADKMSEDVDALFFDANNDGKPDLYVCSGGYSNFMPDDALLQDRLYLNDGKGNFAKSPAALPVMYSSTSCARAADLNGDGSMDLFVGGRVIPGRYPEAPRSYVLLNDGNGHFKDVTATVAPQLQHIGMVTDAGWHDLNGDKKLELVVVGEWMPVTVFKNVNGKLTNATSSYFDKASTGWWNKLLIGDFNQDGRPDLVVGNQGQNAQVRATQKEPAELYYKDFDDNGSVDPILCFYIKGKSYPYVTRDELLDQLSMMRTRFADYASYADATLSDIFSRQELSGAGRLTANNLKTAYFEGGASGRFSQKNLPIEVQFSPVFAISTLDYNHDGRPDLLLGGNISQARLRFGKYDASYGTLLQSNGDGTFTYVPQSRSGLCVKGDVRSILTLNNTVLFGMNQGSIKAYKLKP
ncbi:VCBS repeat-containing protein [Pontibacter liquoris]|uniref:VCBS repeat-containing protein n=1 Tax=Pontibacter liquoris TaxID=2905677 RepID=UPI001FA739F0|nr:VCBS repeat-containing protein [Pontibacter liquoris]